MMKFNLDNLRDKVDVDDLKDKANVWKKLTHESAPDNWDKISKQSLSDDRRYQDVYNQQQLDRTTMAQKQTPFTRNVLCGVAVGICAILLWLFMAVIQFVVQVMPTFGSSDYANLIGGRGAGGNFLACLGPLPLWKILIEVVVCAGVYLVVHELLMRNLKAQNQLTDPSDINQYQNDQHIALPEEVMQKFDWFPDAGAHSSVSVSSMISHVALSNKGIKSIDVVNWSNDEDERDLEFYAALDGDEDELEIEMKPLFDTKFSDDIFEASGVPRDIRKDYNTKIIPYNKGNKNRDKLKDYDTVCDMINADWYMPYYEIQRPGGAYLVDTAPVNTMVLAITRAGKGQTVIEPTIDMWLREKFKNNIVINDPKGELLVKFYVPATVRGFQPVQFNLINAMKTDIYNPLMMAAQAAREGDSTKCALYVENIADVFFPLDGGEDPVWPNAANNAFKRAAYGLIDYYLEEERELRKHAQGIGMDEGTLDTKIDELWGRVTLYNCYQLFVQLTAKKRQNPITEIQNIESKVKKMKDEKVAKGDPIDENDPDWKMYHSSGWEQYKRDANEKAKLWNGENSIDLLTLYFNATECLPRNSMRTLVENANNALKAMGGAEKMMASVYAIAITAMSFFSDPTISTLTSGTPSQNTDLAGLSFPRRIGVQLHPDYCRRYHLIGLQARWQAFEDADFKHPYAGDDFYHEDVISREGWARFFFKGIFPNQKAYLRLQILNAQTEVLVDSFYFEFTKSYQKSLDGRRYAHDPVLDCKIIKNGVLREMVRVGETYEYKMSTFKNTVVTVCTKVEDGDEDSLGRLFKGSKDVPIIINNLVRYAEKPKVVFLVTPPHLMKYAKLILILIKQLVDLNFDQSYMTKSNQKPLYKTRFMLDELGNLQSEGHGISGFETMLSIGLGQDQQFTLILQTLQQLKSIYGDDVDKIVQGNTSNIVFLKSTDDQMLDTLEKMSGKRHQTYTDSKMITRDVEKIWLQNEGKASYTMSTKEEPVISYNDMAFISERNSIVFRAGDSPVWNRNETILPMSWRLFSDTIKQPGKEYSLQTIPTLSSALDFDIRRNQPNFDTMLDKRIDQAVRIARAQEDYQRLFRYSDYDIEQLDPDVYANEIMDIVNERVTLDGMKEPVSEGSGDMPPRPQDLPNKGQSDAIKRAKREKEDREKKRYAGDYLSRSDLMTHQFDIDIVRVYKNIRGYMAKDRVHFLQKDDGSLYSQDGLVLYIKKCDNRHDVDTFNDASKDPTKRTFSDGSIQDLTSYEVRDDFLRFLCEQDDWLSIADGKFETEMTRCMKG